MGKPRDRTLVGSATAVEPRRRWTAAEKAQIVRQHLRDGVAAREAQGELTPVRSCRDTSLPRVAGDSRVYAVARHEA